MYAFFNVVSILLPSFISLLIYKILNKLFLDMSCSEVEDGRSEESSLPFDNESWEETLSNNNDFLEAVMYFEMVSVATNSKKKFQR